MIDVLSSTTAYEALDGQANFKSKPEDFEVEELLLVPFTGTGEHLWMYIEKINTNTDWLAAQLARHFKIPRRCVSYSGLKDRNAVTRQWFSLHMPGNMQAQESVKTLELDDVKVLEHHWHQKKCHLGTHQSNRFKIWLRKNTIDRDKLTQRVNLIKIQGVPNYYGSQRFGIDGQNVTNAQDILASRNRAHRKKAELCVSALRSFLFNMVLKERVEQNTWDKILPGEALQLDGQKGFFLFEQAKESPEKIMAKYLQGECHSTGPLWGEDSIVVKNEVAALENAVFKSYPELIQLLYNRKLNQARRALRLYPRDMEVEFCENNDCCVTFSLTSGCFATTVMTELIPSFQENK